MSRLAPNTMPVSSLQARRDRTLRWFGSALLVLLVLACFSPAFTAGFVSWDDTENLTNNPHWRGFGGEQFRWMLTAMHMGHYQPLTWVSFALDFSLWEMDPRGYHATNLFIHAANAVLFFLLGRRLLHLAFAGQGEPGEVQPRTTALALLAAALWAIHPLRAESVAWVTERRDVLSTLFMLLSGLAYLRAFEPGRVQPRSWPWYWACAGLLLLSCLSKAWGMTFFVVLLALDIAPLARLSLSRPFSTNNLRVLAQKLPMILVGLATAVMAARAQHAGLATKTLAQWPLESRLAQSAYGLWFYVLKSVAPSGLSPLYQIPEKLDPTEPRFLAAYAFVFLAFIGVVLAWRKNKQSSAPMAAAIYLVFLAPVLGLLQSGEQLVADRYSYLAAMPLALLAAGAAQWLLGRMTAAAANVAKLSVAAACVVTASLGALTFSQTAVWHDSYTLWAHAVEVAPSPYSMDYLADELLRRAGKEQDPRVRDEQERQAATLYRQAVEASPKDGRAWFCLANILKEHNQRREAERAYLESIKYLPVAYQAHQNLGIMYLDMGRKDDAYHQFELAVADLEDTSKGTRPVSGGPYMVLGLARVDQGRKDEAAALFKKALPYQDTHDDAQTQLQRLK